MSRLNPISEERKREIKNAVIKELKSLIFPTIVLLLIAGVVFFVMTYQKIKVEEEPIQPEAYDGDGNEVVLENDSLKFVLDPATTNFTVTVKSSGKVWSSYAVGGIDDSAAINEEKNKLNSSFILTYGTDAGLDTSYDSYYFSSLNQIFNIVTEGDSVRVDYSLGKVAKEFVIPPVISVERLSELTSTMSVTDSENVKQFYKKYDINNLSKKDAKNKDELLANYPILETQPMYILRDGLKDTAKKSLEKQFEAAGYTYEEYLADKELNMKEASNDNPVFKASVIYKLDGDDLLVEVPMSSLEGKEEYPIYTINILPYFGSGSTSDEGYMLVPEGGGSIINFNNGRTSQSVYYANLYGWDMALERAAVVHNTLASMNVYGISDYKDSFICILEDGSSYASIQADISGKTSSYNYVTAIYSIKPREKYDLGSAANTDMFVYLPELPDESIVKRYSFIDSGSYVDMAKDYRSYLIDKYPGYFTENDDTSTPVAVEVVGAVDKVKQIMGIPVSRPLALTTYDEASELITELKDGGIDNLSVKYTGWCNGGVRQKYLKHIHTIGALGSKRDLKDLSALATNLGVDLYLDGITEYEFESNIFHGFFSYRDAAKFLSRKRAELYEYSAVTYSAREGLDSYFLLHGDTIIKMAENLVEETKGYNTGVSFQDIGHDLSSDFYRKDYTSRDEAMDMQVDLLKNVKDSGQKIMINDGNAYALPYADMITNMDLRGSEYTIIDYCVPFYQIAVHGYVDYTGFPINTCGNEEEAVLYAAEYGAGLSFSLMKESPFTLQKTLYTEYYASDYSAWSDELFKIYQRYDSELGHTFNQTIEDHRILTDDVSVTTYEDGTKVYVNYGFGEYSDGGVKVPARDYLVVR
ncbi:MAG: hypothetical protein J6U67_06290 [Lachnospiraceae bacterium]|nr:hypothetical protein [Lachnospiraceae bacterium]